jgi:hypothetical protein
MERLFLIARCIDWLLWPFIVLANNIPSDQGILRKLPWLPAVGAPLEVAIKWAYIGGGLHPGTSKPGLPTLSAWSRHRIAVAINWLAIRRSEAHTSASPIERTLSGVGGWEFCDGPAWTFVGASIMPEYRFYSFTDGNRIAGPPKFGQCSSDQEAIVEARKLLDGLDIEIWQAARVVTRLKSSDK